MEHTPPLLLADLITDGYINTFELREGILYCNAYPNKCYKITEVIDKKVFPDLILQQTIYALITPDGIKGTFLIPWQGLFEEY